MSKMPWFASTAGVVLNGTLMKGVFRGEFLINDPRKTD